MLWLRARLGSPTGMSSITLEIIGAIGVSGGEADEAHTVAEAASLRWAASQHQATRVMGRVRGGRPAETQATPAVRQPPSP